MPEWQAITASLGEAGLSIDPTHSPRAVGGGDISAAWCVTSRSGPVFLKTGSAEVLPMFEAEAAGLDELRAANAVRVPRVLACGKANGGCYLALEWLDLGSPTSTCERLLGEQLAAQHRVTAAQHGWERDNTIGLTPQLNGRTDDWLTFYRDNRLRYQLELAVENGFSGRLQQRGALLLEALPELLADHVPEPSLLHGDLWAGNHASTDGVPVIFDPAVYYGDRETDLAMTRLFGGFPRSFYAAYEQAWPLPAGHEQRLGLYQLYHVLNHLNLFGSGYLGRAESLIEASLARAT